MPETRQTCPRSRMMNNSNRKPYGNKYKKSRTPHGNSSHPGSHNPNRDEPNFNLKSEIDEYGVRTTKSRQYIEKEHRKYGYSVDTLNGNATQKHNSDILPNVNKVWRPDNEIAVGAGSKAKPSGPGKSRYGTHSAPSSHPGHRRKIDNSTPALAGPSTGRNSDSAGAGKPTGPNKNAKRGKPFRPKQKVSGVPKTAEEGELRLNKYLSQQGVSSRRHADELIEAGKVKINGKVVKELGIKVDPATDKISVGGLEVSNKPEPNYYLVMNKPKDTITTRSDEKDRKIVMDLIDEDLRKKVVPVGRLDRDTTGTLLLTNDGELTYRLTHPSYQVPRVYHVVLDKKILKKTMDTILSGVMIDGEAAIVSSIEYNIDKKNEVFLTLNEGKNREVRKIFETVGYVVEKLDRITFAGMNCEGLKRGEFRQLTKTEITYLKSIVDIR